MTATRPPALPVDDFLPEVVRLVAERRALVVTAAPGAGKTTRIPPALVGAGRVLVLQPRRVAARSIARRIADERGWRLGSDVGWHVRFERRFTASTPLVVATEGVLTARLQADPLLSDITTLVLDEFHERSLHADLGLALAREAWRARPDLRIVVMSATVDPAPVSQFLDDCPVLEIPGRTHPVTIDYRPGVDVESAVAGELPQMSGALLCFLPGAADIKRAADRLASRIPGVVAVPLHGSLDADEQDRALQPSERPRVILATNLAETTLTVPDVRVVIDTGWQKVARYDAARGIDSLDVERVSQDSADQRAGRAGRLGPGRAIRLWDRRDRLVPHREPDITRVDLAPAVLDLVVWGGKPATFSWFEAPRPDRLDAAVALLVALGALDAGGAVTRLGDLLRRFPLHPRLSRVLVAAGGAPLAARACALLSERHFTPASGEATTSDVFAAADDERRLPDHVRRVARDLESMARAVLGAAAKTSLDDAGLSRALLAGYPDRIARRRAMGSDRFLLASGTGATLGRGSGVVGAEFVVAVDVVRGATSAAPEAVIHLASAVEREWIPVTHREVEHVLDHDRGTVRAMRVDRHGAIVLSETPVAVDRTTAAALIARAYIDRGWRVPDEQLFARLRAAGLTAAVDPPEALVLSAARAQLDLHALDLVAALPPDVRRRLDRGAPELWLLPSGRRARLDYRPDGRIVAAVKLQEVFGLGETPRVGARQIPVTFELLAPNGRPVQITSDLASFWHRGYPEVRRELRARYPKHPWPEDPWTAMPTHRPRPRSRQ